MGQALPLHELCELAGERVKDQRQLLPELSMARQATTARSA